MTITTLDTHETVKNLTAAGFSDIQAEAVTHALRRAIDIDLSNLATKDDIRDMATKADIRDMATKADIMATKADIRDVKADLAREAAELRREMAEIKAETIKWVVGMGFAQVAMILAVLKLFPAGHP
ncbi:MAG TPA: hypothetical protein VFW46_03690 [Stellaceae bacterium]|nr:hypothetical protein [Stellaceae bacterium]